MRKFALLLLIVLVAFSSLFSCRVNGPDSGDGGTIDGGSGGDAGSDGGVADDGTDSGAESVSVAIVVPDCQNQILNDTVYLLYENISEVVNKTPQIIKPTDEEQPREIVFGRTDRAVSVEAYRRLNRMDVTDEQLYDEDPRILIYSDGNSVAIAYDDSEDDIGAITATKYFNENFAESFLELKTGTLYREVVSLDDYYQVIDDQKINAEWAELLALAGDEMGDDIVSALKYMYCLYTDDVISWFANLYEPAIGGYYYSNSGRNTDGYLPDAESTEQALRFINQSGMLQDRYSDYTEALPEEISKQIVDFIYGLQDPNGYFYHPQWSKDAVDNRVSRRSRDLSHCVSILSAYGVTPKYKTPSGVDGADELEPVSYKALTGRLMTSCAGAVSKLVAVSDSQVAVDPNLKDEKSFRDYLDSLNVQTESYSAGNTLTAFFNEIKYRDEVLKSKGADYSLVDILIEHLNEKQFQHNGLWHAETNYYAVNGLMKISGVYSKAGVPFPNSEKALRAAIDAITTDQEAGSVTDIYNTWFAVCRMFNIIKNTEGEEGAALVDSMRGELFAKAPQAIRTTADKLSAFKKNDGSFSYTPAYSSTNSQGMPVAVPKSVEGDINATLICTSDILGYIYNALGLSSEFVPIYTYNDWRNYRDILVRLGPVIKDVEEPIYEPITFDEYAVSNDPNVDYISASARSKANGGGVAVTPDVRAGYGGNVFKITSVAGTSDSINIESANLSHSFSCFGFEGDFCIVSTDSEFPVRITMGECYIISVKVVDGHIRLVQSTSETASKSKDTLICTGPAVGEWFSLRVEYYKGDHNTVRIKFYFDGDLTDGKKLQLVAVTDGYLDSEGTKFIEGFGEPAAQFSSTNLWFMKGCNIEMLMDNVASYKSNDTYHKYTNVSSPLKINVDAPVPGDDDSSGAPEYTNTYYNLSSVDGTRYDYSGKLGKGYIYNKTYNSETSQSTTSVPVVTDVLGGKLNVSVLSNWAGFAIANLSENKTASSGARYVFDTTFSWLGGRQSEGSGAAAYIGVLGAHASVDNNYMPLYTTVSFSTEDPDILLLGNAELEKGKAYNIRVEYEPGGGLSIYVDNFPVTGFDVYEGAKADDSTYEAFGFYMRKNFIDPFDFILDNTFIGVVYPDSDGDMPIEPVDPYAPPADEGLPENLETYYANPEYTGTRYDFTNAADYTAGSIYNKIYDKASQTSSVTVPKIGKVENGKLVIDNNGLAWQGVAFANGGNVTGGNGYTYVFEADIRWLSGHQATAQLASGAAFFGFLGEHASVDNGYMSAFGYLKFIEGESDKMIIGNTEIKRGTTYNIRFEFTVGTGVAMYVNGNLTDFGVLNKGANGDSLAYEAFGIYVRRDVSPDLELTFDNVYMGVIAPAAVEPSPKDEVGYTVALNAPENVNVTASSDYTDEIITVNLNAENADSTVYTDVLTLKVVIPDEWEAAKITIGAKSVYAPAKSDGEVSYVELSAASGDTVILTEAKASDVTFYTYYSDGSVQGSRYDFEDGELPSAFVTSNEKTSTPTTLTVANGVLEEKTSSWYGFAVLSGDDKAYSAGKYVFEADFVMNKAVYKDAKGSAFIGFITYADQVSSSITIQNTTTNAAAFADVYMTVSSDASSFGWFGETLSVGKKYNLRAVYDVETDVCTVYVNGVEVASAEYGTSNSVKSRDDSVYRGFMFYPRVSGMEFTLDNVFVGVIDGVEQ